MSYYNFEVLIFIFHQHLQSETHAKISSHTNEERQNVTLVRNR